MFRVRRVRTRVLGLWGGLAIALGGCGTSKEVAPPPPPAPLRVAAASDLGNALASLAEPLHRERRIELSMTFGSSGQLAEQIKAGAPFDVFLAANQKFVKDLADGGFVRPESVAPYARGTLVLAVHRSAEDSIKDLIDLTRPEVKKIALANPATAPYGAAGKQALERAGLWEQVAPKIVQAESVRQALQYVESGNVEAGLVGAAIGRPSEILRVFQVDPKLYDPIIQGLGIVAKTDKGADAEAFRRLVLSDSGQQILRQFGFASPEPNPGPEAPAAKDR